MTYFLVRLFGGSNGEKVGRHEVDSLQWWTGAVLTFSVSPTYVWDDLQRAKTGVGFMSFRAALFSTSQLSYRHSPMRMATTSRGREIEQTRSLGITGHGHGLAVDPERSPGWT
jgi:hypothetical protein